MLKKYLLLIKPGIIAGNATTAIAGYMMARENFNGSLLFFMILGLSCIIGSGCIFNNFMDRYYDQKMARTKNRALACGTIPTNIALLLASSMLLLGSLLLFYMTNTLCLLSALFGFFIYVCVYTPLKVRSHYGTIVGSIAGAIPPVVGYTAASAQLDKPALLLFLLIALWQMPHFYAIAIYRLDEYANAKIPVLPYIKGMETTKRQMILYTLAFGLCSLLLYLHAPLGEVYLVVALLCSFIWLYIAVKGSKASDEKKWAKNMFRFSLIIIMTFSAFISLRY